MTVYKCSPDEQSALVVKAEETYRTPILPGFELPLAELLKVADEWARSASRRQSQQ